MRQTTNPANSAVEQGPARRFLAEFVDHPARVGETYFQHLCFALGFASTLFLAGGAALIHALCPPLFETTASRIVRRLNARLEKRH